MTSGIRLGLEYPMQKPGMHARYFVAYLSGPDEATTCGET